MQRHDCDLPAEGLRQRNHKIFTIQLSGNYSNELNGIPAVGC